MAAVETEKVWGERLNGMRMKTAVTILQEMMVKLGQAPEYECIAKESPAHQALFTVACRAGGVAATATARSKKEAKQEAARRALELLAAGALEPPPPARSRPEPAPGPARSRPEPAPAPPADTSPAPEPFRSHVALLAELCDHMGLLAPVYGEVSADGPPHSRVFTWTAHVGGAVRRGVARSKKAARQLAAAALYRHLRDNLPQHAEHFDEEAALVRAHERAMERYSALVPERAPSALALPLADYHKALSGSIDEPRRLAALAATEALDDSAAEAALAAAAAALGLPLVALVLPPATAVLALSGAVPPLAAAAAPPSKPARAALRLLRRLLRHPAPPAAEPEPLPPAGSEPEPLSPARAEPTALAPPVVHA